MYGEGGAALPLHDSIGRFEHVALDAHTGVARDQLAERLMVVAATKMRMAISFHEGGGARPSRPQHRSSFEDLAIALSVQCESGKDSVSAGSCVTSRSSSRNRKTMPPTRSSAISTTVIAMRFSSVAPSAAPCGATASISPYI